MRNNSEMKREYKSLVYQYFQILLVLKIYISSIFKIKQLFWLILLQETPEVKIGFKGPVYCYLPKLLYAPCPSDFKSM